MLPGNLGIAACIATLISCTGCKVQSNLTRPNSDKSLKEGQFLTAESKHTFNLCTTYAGLRMHVQAELEIARFFVIEHGIPVVQVCW